MKVGDLVRHRSLSGGVGGIVVDIIQKKVWRTGALGGKVNWNEVAPEPHAVVFWAHNRDTLNIPVVELEVIG